MLSPLEKYESAVPYIPLDNIRLLDTASAGLHDALDRFYDRRKSPEVRSAWVNDILQRLPQIAASMPTMTEKGHRQKYLVVLDKLKTGELTKCEQNSGKT